MPWDNLNNLLANAQTVAMNAPPQQPSFMSSDVGQAPIPMPPPPPPMPMRAKPKPLLPLPDDSDDSDDTPPPQTSAGEQAPDLSQYKVTPEELQDARDNKRQALMIGSIAEPLANQQSFGNFFLGHMNQKVDTMGPAKAAADAAMDPIKDKQTLMAQAVADPKNKLQMIQELQQQQQSKDMNTPGSQMAILNASITARVAGKAGVPIDEKELAGMTFQQQQDTINKNPILADAIKEDTEGKRMNAMMMRMQASQGIQQQRLNLQGEKFAAAAGKDVESSVKPFKTVLNSLGKSESILNGTEPVTVTDLANAQQDYINSIAAGGAATEGKTNREMVSDFPMLLNKFEQKFGTQADIRKSDPALVDHLKAMIQKVKGDVNGQMTQQQQATAGNYAASDNQKVKDTIAGKNKLYGQGYQPTSLDTPPAQGQMDPQDAEALKYAKENRGSADAQRILLKIAKKYPGSANAL
jgi:hypothetical protein